MLMPAVDAIGMLASLGNQYAGLPASRGVGWLLHFLVGIVLWGLLFVALNSAMPGGSQTVKGIVFSIAAWLLMMIIPMPMAGAGLFAVNLGIGAPIATLILHIIFGAVLGAVYGLLRKRSGPHVLASP